MTQPHASPRPAEPPATRFVTLHVPAGPVAEAPVADRTDVVLARAGGPLRPDALVVAREPRGYAVRRVGRVTDDVVELLGDGADELPRRVPRDARDLVVGTVLLRWHADDAA